MVRVVSLTKDEISLREKRSKLLGITEKFIGTISQRVDLSKGLIRVSHHSPEAPGHSILIDPTNNMVFVESRNYFEQAMKLAEVYEKAFRDEEFIIKQNY